MPTLPLIITPDPDEPDALDVRLDVEIAGETVRAVLDTGGGSSTFATTPATEALEVVGPATGRGATGAVAPDDVVVLPSLSLGPLVVTGLRPNRMPAGDKRPPSVGMDALGRHRWHFRFGNHLAEVDEAVPSQMSPLPLATLPGAQPIVPIRFGAVEATALWDTGAALTFVNESFVAAHPELFEVTGQAEAVDSAGARFSTPRATMAGCEIGGVGFGSTPCGIFDLTAINETLETPIDLGIGAPLIVLNDWLFDFPDGTWSVAPASDAP